MSFNVISCLQNVISYFIINYSYVRLEQRLQTLVGFSQNRMSYADKFLQQAPIPPPRRRKKKMVETTKL